MRDNFFADIPESIPQEMIETVISSNSVRIERIVSQGQYSAVDFWYDQTENEWVIILDGEAILEFEDKEIKLGKGDYLLIPAHQKHRVKWTDPNRQTVWLAVFY